MDTPNDAKCELEGLYGGIMNNKSVWRMVPFKYNHHAKFLLYTLVTCGVVPPHYPDCERTAGATNYIQQFVNALEPWFQQQRRLLEKRGFRLAALWIPWNFASVNRRLACTRL